MTTEQQYREQSAPSKVRERRFPYACCFLDEVDIVQPDGIGHCSQTLSFLGGLQSTGGSLQGGDKGRLVRTIVGLADVVVN